MNDQNIHKPNDTSFLVSSSNENLPWWQKVAAEDYLGQLRSWSSDTWQANKSLVVLAAVVVLGVGVTAGLMLNGQSTDTRSQASVSNGPAVILLSPTGSTMTPNTKQKIDIMATTGLRPVVGFQLVLTISGRVPSDMKFTPAPMTGFQVLRNTYSKGRLEFASVLPPKDAGFVPFSTQAPVVLGSLEFTTPKNGDMTISFSATETLIADYETNKDISRAPSATRYYFKR